MKLTIMIMFFGDLALDVFATGRKLTWSREKIAAAREVFVFMVENGPNHRRWIVDENNWEDCWKIYNDAVAKGWMTHLDVEDWKAERVAPRLVDGKLKGIMLQCGCFHPQSMIDVLDPVEGKRFELSAASVVERRREFALIYLDRDAAADNFVGSYSPIKMTTHGKEFFENVDSNSLANC